MKRMLAKHVMAGVVAASLATGMTPAFAAENVNTLDTVISDMTKENDKVLAYNGEVGKRFYGPGTLVMGTNPHGDQTPDYYKKALVYPDFKDADAWNAMVPWLEIFTARENQARNTSVEMSNIKLYVLRKSTGKWQEVSDTAVDGKDFPKHGASGDVLTPDLHPEGDNKVVTPASDINRMFHGWGSETDTRELAEGFPTTDIKAVFATVNARLVKKDDKGTDDRDKSEYHLQMGTDYYPDKGVRTEDERILMKGEDGKPMRNKEGKPIGTYFPGVGVSRAKRVTNDWQAFNFVTIWDEEGKITQDDNNGISIKERAISVDELRKNPPPLN